MFNDRLERVQVGRSKDVPLKVVWYFWYYNNGSLDSDNVIPKELKKEDIKEIFAIWHGQYRTNMFLMDKNELIKS